MRGLAPKGVVEFGLAGLPDPLCALTPRNMDVDRSFVAVVSSLRLVFDL